MDRLNPKVADYYQSYHPATFRLIAQVVQAFTCQGKPIGICGELGGEPLASAELVGLGMRKLSMSAGSAAAVKKQVRRLNVPRAERLARTILGLATASRVEAFLKGESLDEPIH